MAPGLVRWQPVGNTGPGQGRSQDEDWSGSRCHQPRRGPLSLGLNVALVKTLHEPGLPFVLPPEVRTLELLPTHMFRLPNLEARDGLAQEPRRTQRLATTGQ
jgi:hypothetical protein